MATRWLPGVRGGHAERLSGPALADAAELARLLGQLEQQRNMPRQARRFRKRSTRIFGTRRRGPITAAIKDGKKTPPTVHAAAMCLYFDAVPSERRKRVERWFLANIEREGCLPYQHAFYFEVLARMNSDAADRLAIRPDPRTLGAMARYETKTTWEGFGPGENCHESGGAPTIYLSRHVLGVQVDGPVANRRLMIEPHLGDLKRVEGIVVTEFGPVPVVLGLVG